MVECKIKKVQPPAYYILVCCNKKKTKCSEIPVEFKTRAQAEKGRKEWENGLTEELTYK